MDTNSLEALVVGCQDMEGVQDLAPPAQYHPGDVNDLVGQFRDAVFEKIKYPYGFASNPGEHHLNVGCGEGLRGKRGLAAAGRQRLVQLSGASSQAGRGFERNT